jgi:hypothetical protein
MSKVPSALSPKDFIVPTVTEAAALAQRLFEAKNAEEFDRMATCFTDPAIYYLLGWTHPSGVKFYQINDWNRHPVHSERFLQVNGLSRAKDDARGCPTWAFFFVEEITTGGSDDRHTSRVERHTIVAREHGALRFQEYQ